MTIQEKKILEIIKANPLIEQAEIAKLLGIKRSTVAVHICNLQKQGYIVGKGYILNKDEYVLGIGAANIDIYGKSTIEIRRHYDHPAFITSNVGGVSKNILTNLSRLDVKTKLITSIGNDNFGKTIIDDCKSNSIDTNNIVVSNDNATSVFMQVQNDDNDMYLALCDMSVLDEVSPEYIERKKNVLLGARIVLIDSALRLDTIEKIIEICSDAVPIYIDPISDNYALKIKPYVGSFTCIKPNKSELENLSGMKVNNNADMQKACKKLIDKGLKKIYVSCGKDGILYMDNEGNCINKKLKPVKDVVNASGAGDAAMAGIIYGTINNLKQNDIIDFGLAAGIAAIKSSKTINDDMSVSLLKKIIKEN